MSRLILFVTEQVKPGGKLSHVEALSAGLEHHGWTTERLDWNALSFVEKALVAGPMRLLDSMQRGLGQRWSLPALNQRFAAHLRIRLSRRGVTDIVHVQEPLTFRAAAGAARGIPIALTVHGPVHREVASAWNLALDHPVVRWLREIERRAYLEAAAVIAVDQAHLEYVREFGREHDVWSIPNFVDTRRFHPAVSPERFPDEVEQWIAGRPVVLCPRRLVPKNGVAVAIRAGAEIASRGLPVAVVIVGDGPQRSELEQLAAEPLHAPHSRLIGEAGLERMPGWIRRSDVVVVPSVPSKGVEEATSISAIEAQACGRPVVASAIGGLREIIRDGETGLLVPAGSAPALAEAVLRALREPGLATRLETAAALEVTSLRSHEAGAARYVEVYETLRDRESR
ncbi:MAG: glycosyltransferase family 4 protein [Candidatus Eisenbacteria bacterium]|uniref:Glycosyltransferase family 4 protein n=1 Tax=Eiseniibacteriota bacterium TaxID=2212470 RepID=A0A849SR83_UNCEI|nr:glycosyltransferase family 4 protein [Candidatus Eisenbacteria bacterium]